MGLNEKNKQRTERTQAKLDNKNLFPMHHEIKIDVLEFINITDLKVSEFLKDKGLIKDKITMSEEKIDGVLDILEENGFSPLKVEVSTSYFDEEEFRHKCLGKMATSNIKKAFKEVFGDTNPVALSSEELFKKLDEVKEKALASI